MKYSKNHIGIKAEDVNRLFTEFKQLAFAMKGDDQEAFDAGCDGYITKPTLTLVAPVFGDLFGSLVQPVYVSREPNHFNGRKAFDTYTEAIGSESNEVLTG